MQPRAVVDVVQETGEVGADGCVCGAAPQHPHLQHLRTPLWHIRPILGALCLSTQQQSKSPSLLSHHYPGESGQHNGSAKALFLVCGFFKMCESPSIPQSSQTETNVKAPLAESAHSFSGKMCVCCNKCLLKVVLPVQHLILEAHDICRFHSLNHRKIHTCPPVLQLRVTNITLPKLLLYFLNFQISPLKYLCSRVTDIIRLVAETCERKFLGMRLR